MGMGPWLEEDKVHLHGRLLFFLFLLLARAQRPEPSAQRPQTAARPRAISSRKSSTFSSPTDMRSSPSAIPARSRSSAVMRECVVVHGCVIVVFTSPKLAVIDIKRVASMKDHAPTRPPSTSKATILPKADC